MITIPNLQTALLDLLHELKDSDIKIIVGGGFGIYLKVEYVREMGERTLIAEWPEARSTNDLDLFLRPELLIESRKIEPLAEAIQKLGYQAIPSAMYYQFVKPGPKGDDEGSIKIDLLTGPQEKFKGTNVKADRRRAKPNPSVGIHAHPLNEAPTLEEGLLQRTLVGKLSSGEVGKAQVYLPHPFTFLMMKIFALRDRLDDETKDFGRYHALDMYTILATMTEKEWDTALELRERFADEPFIQEASEIVDELFSSPDSKGMLRLRESRYFRREFNLDQFMSALVELFPRER